MELTVLHQTTYRYDTPVGQIALLLRLQPPQLNCQTPRDWQVSVNGEPVSTFHANGFGDSEAFFQQRRPVRELSIVASGSVETSDRHGVVSGFRQEAPLPVFLRQTDLTRPDAAIRAFAQSVVGPDTLGRLHALSGLVREVISYRPGSTSTASTAAEALALMRGGSYDILLTDFDLGDGWGTDLLAFSKQVAPAARALLMTGNAAQHAALKKPFTAGELLSAVSS